MNIRINPDACVDRVPIDPDHDCLVIDDFLVNPEDVIAYAVAQKSAFFMQERAYPGLILPLAEQYASPLHQFIRSQFSRVFGFLRGDIDFQTQISLTTMQPEEFSWIQCLPHSDPRLETGRANYATVLYLFRDTELGGTGFYRWRDPAFWQEMTAMQMKNPDGGLDILRERFEMFRKPWAYTTGSNEAVELLAMVPARFNRLIGYPGDLPHNAFVSDPSRLSDDPSRGRLTLNSFASVWPRG